MTTLHLIVTIIFVIVTTSALNVRTKDDVKTIDINTVPWTERKLHVPQLRVVARALKAALSKNYADVSVEIQDTPDLTKAPFYLATEGLSGQQTVLDVGGDPYLLPVPNLTKVYDFVDIAQKAFPNTKTVSINGPAAGPFMINSNQNCEGIFNLQISNDNGNISVNGKSHFARVVDDGSAELVKVPSNETRFAFTGHFYSSEGKRGKVVHVKAKRRIGKQGNFVTICREAVRTQSRNKTVGIGGVFAINNGVVLQHIMPDFPDGPIEDTLKWLKFFNMSSPLVAVGTFLTDATDLGLRLDHFHSNAQSKWGGHYYNDTTPDTIEYEAYFNVAHRAVRVDRPPTFVN